MSETTAQTTSTAVEPLTITKELLREWQACTDGVRWFLGKFPQGASYGDVQSALRAAKRDNDSRWLTDRVFESLLKTPSATAKVVADFKTELDLLIAEAPKSDVAAEAQVTNDSGDSAQIGSSGYSAQIGSSGDSARIGSSGYYAQIGSSGYYAQIGSSGDSARIGSSGYYAQIGSSGDSARIGSSGDSARIGSSGYSARIGSSGDSAQIGSSGYYARIGSSGDSARIGSSGYSARINAEGSKPTVAVAGLDARVRVGAEGAVSVAYNDGTRIRFAVGYVGENIKANTWYQVSDKGEFVECEA